MRAVIPLKSPSLPLALGLALSLGSGCFSAKRVKTLRVVDGKSLSMCPGVPERIEVRAKMMGGKVYTTAPGPGKDLSWRKLEVMLGDQSQAGGLVVMPPDPRDTWKSSLPLKVWLDKRPELVWEGVVTPRYDCSWALDFAGQSGAPGYSGLSSQAEDGDDGEDASASSSGQYRGDGEDGRRGENGRDGQLGQHGQDAGQVDVYVTQVRIENMAYLEVRVIGEVLRDNSWVSEEHTVLMDLHKGRMTIDVSGGDGGNGEDGQRGGDGGDGGQGLEDGDDGRGGHGGNGGDGGDGGDAGLVVFHVSPSAEGFLDHFHVNNSGGAGGSGGDGGYAGSGAGSARDGVAGRPGAPGRPGPEPAIVVEEVVPFL